MEPLDARSPRYSTRHPMGSDDDGDPVEASERSDSGPLEQRLDQLVPRDRARGESYLLVVAGAEPGRLYPLGAGENILGRGPQANIRLIDGSISGEHARLVSVGERLRLFDLGSTNGTFVNGELVSGDVELRGGDAIVVGETQLLLLAASDGVEPTVTLQRLGPSAVSARGPRPGAGGTRGGRRDDVVDMPGGHAGAPPGVADLIARIRLVLAYARRYWALMLAFAALGVAGGVAYAKARPPHGSAWLELTLVSEVRDSPVAERNAQRSTIEFFSAARSNFKSLELITRTLEQMGVDHIDSEQVALIEERLDFINEVDRTRRRDPGAQLWRAHYEAATAEQAKSFLETHLQLYLESEIEKTLKVFRAESEFLARQLEGAETALAEIERKVVRFKEENAAVLPAGAAEHYAAIANQRGRRGELSARASRAKLELELTRKRLASEDAILQRKVASAQGYEAALVDINRRIGEAQARGLAEAHPELANLRSQAAELRRLADGVVQSKTTELDRRSNPEHARLRERVHELEVEAQVAESELGHVAGSVAQLEDVVKDLPEVEATYSQLLRDQASKRELRDNLFSKLKSTELQLELERASAAAHYDVITRPTAVEPDLIKALAKRVILGMVLGLALAIGVAALIELRRLMAQP